MTEPYLRSFEAEVLERLGRIETHAEGAVLRLDDHETRVRTLEKKQYWLAGAAAVLYPILQHTGLFPWLKS